MRSHWLIPLLAPCFLGSFPCFAPIPLTFPAPVFGLAHPRGMRAPHLPARPLVADRHTGQIQQGDWHHLVSHSEHVAYFHGRASQLNGERVSSSVAHSRTAIDPLLQDTIDLVNTARRDAGLPPVQVSDRLMIAAAHYSQTLAAQGRLSHRGPDGSSPGQRLQRAGYNWTACGENLAAGYATAQAVVSGWLRSAAHRRNLLHPGMREIGIGWSHREDDPSGYVNYWVLELATPRR